MREEQFLPAFLFVILKSIQFTRMTKYKLIIVFFFITILTVVGQKLDKQTRKYLKSKLDTISQIDQKYRWELAFGELDSKKIDSLKKLPHKLMMERMSQAGIGKVGFNKEIKDSIWKLQKNLDSLNSITFIELINKYGYPSYKRTKSYTSFTLALHLMGKNNFEKLLPIFSSELEKGNMPPSEYANWYDRNQIIAKKKQLYGEYDKKFPCVENIEKTNLARKKIGLRLIKRNNCKNN